MRLPVVAALVLASALATACRKQAEPPPASDIPVMPAGEIKRGQGACKAYVDKVCACARGSAALAQPCELARAYPDAMQVGLDIASSSDAKRRDVLQAHESVRAIVKKCIEETAQLPSAGCP